MDNNTLPIVYLSVLLVVLVFAGGSIFRQVLKTRRLETSLSRLQKKLSKDQGTSQEYYELGSIHLNKKLFAQAIPVFQKALKAAAEEGEENVALMYNGIGVAYFAQEQYDMAIRQYKEALKHDPNYITGLNNLAHAYERKALTPQALQTYEQVLQLEPNNSTAKRRSNSLRKRLVTSA